MDSEPVLRSIFEGFFTLIPTGFFVQMLDLMAALLNGIFGIFGISTNIVGF